MRSNLMHTAISHRSSVRLMIFVAAICILGLTALRSEASAPSATVTINNNSSWEIRAIYLSAVDNDNWGDDQLSGSVIAPGGSYSLNLSWGQPTVKIVAEDNEGCFISTTADATSNSSWTISSGSARNCGGSN